MSEWQRKKLRELPIQILDGDRSGRYPKREEFVPEGVLFVNTTNIQNNTLCLDGVNYIAEQKYGEIRKGRVEKFDVLMTTRGSIGKVALYTDERPALINAQMLLMRADQQQLDAAFLFQTFRGSSFQVASEFFLGVSSATNSNNGLA